jgi:hypothetical protein
VQWQCCAQVGILSIEAELRPVDRNDGVVPAYHHSLRQHNLMAAGMEITALYFMALLSPATF